MIIVTEFFFFEKAKEICQSMFFFFFSRRVWIQYECLHGNTEAILGHLNTLIALKQYCLGLAADDYSALV